MIRCSCGKCRLKSYSIGYASGGIYLTEFCPVTRKLSLHDCCPGCGESADDVWRNWRIAQKQRKIKRAQRKIEVLRAEQ